MKIAAIDQKPAREITQALAAMELAGPEVSLETDNGAIVRWNIGTLPPRSLPVHPTQIYSAINALLLSLVVVACEPYLQRAGSVLALMLTLYPPLRIVEEMLRADEPGQFQTGMTISQLISVGMLVVAAGLWIYVYRREPASGGEARQDTGLSAA
jgi:phosphatidylglycerol:prolipoprotein diacylglycerol transferase